MIIKRFSFCNRYPKQAFFISLCYSGSLLWTSYIPEQRRHIKETHNDILRRVTNTARSKLNSASTMFAGCSLRTIQEIIKHSMSNLICHFQRSLNSIIMNVLLSIEPGQSQRWGNCGKGKHLFHNLLHHVFI